MSKNEKNKSTTKKMNILTKNFELIFDLMKLHKTSLEKSYFLLFFCFSLLYISNLRIYRDLLIINYQVDTNIDSLLDILKYFDILYLI
jgi:hypothetical protein